MKRYMSVFRKTLLEQLRSPFELLFIIITAPLFVLVYWLFFGGGSTTYQMLIINNDRGEKGNELVSEISGLAYSDGRPLLKIIPQKSRDEAEKKLRDRDASALLIIPEDFSECIDQFRTTGKYIDGSAITLSGDLTNPTYSISAIFASSVVDRYLQIETDQIRPITIVEEPLGGSGSRSEFEIYVPGLFVIAMVMMVFSSAMRVSSEIENGGFQRLALTAITPFEYLAGVSTVQVLVGIITVIITFIVAVGLGFRSEGQLWLALLIGALTSFSVIGMGLIVASFSRTTTEAFIFANLPMILMMFFSGSAFPISRVELLHIGGKTISLFDVLPQTHAVLALNKVLTLGAGFQDVMYEAAMVFFLSLVYFMIGVWIFNKKVLLKYRSVQ